MVEKYLVRSRIVVVLWVILVTPTTVLAQYTFGDWARDHGYSPGDVMPGSVWATNSSIESLDGIGEYDWTTTPTEYLNLDSNQIKSIEVGVFRGLTNLKELYLDSNQIKSIESGDFNWLSNLKKLDLSSNQIPSIESGAFRGLPNLLRLNLSNNQIPSIESSDFSELSNLMGLDLDDNQISSIESDDLSGLANLQSLSLNCNQITSIEAGAFSGLTNLRMLNLYKNQITSIESGDLDGLTNLMQLFLTYNQIMSIESGAFSGLSNLFWLHLGYNQITSIESGDFDGLTNLAGLYLESNQLMNIETGAFRELANLAELTLNQNPSLTELNLAEDIFMKLTRFDVRRNVNISNVSLRNTTINQKSFDTLLFGGIIGSGIGELDGITKLDLSGVNFRDINRLIPLGAMDDLIELWLVDAKDLDPFQLDFVLDILATMRNPEIEGTLYMTQADFDALNTAGGGLLAAWDAEPGHHVEIVIPEPASIVLLFTLITLVLTSCGMRKSD